MCLKGVEWEFGGAWNERKQQIPIASIFTLRAIRIVAPIPTLVSHLSLCSSSTLH